MSCSVASSWLPEAAARRTAAASTGATAARRPSGGGGQGVGRGHGPTVGALAGIGKRSGSAVAVADAVARRSGATGQPAGRAGGGPPGGAGSCPARRRRRGRRRGSRRSGPRRPGGRGPRSGCARARRSRRSPAAPGPRAGRGRRAWARRRTRLEPVERIAVRGVEDADGDDGRLPAGGLAQRPDQRPVAGGGAVDLDDQPGVLPAGQQRRKLQRLDARPPCPRRTRRRDGRLRLRLRGRLGLPGRTDLAHGPDRRWRRRPSRQGPRARVGGERRPTSFRSRYCVSIRTVIVARQYR